MELEKRVLLKILSEGKVTRKEIVTSFNVAKSTLSYVLSKLKEKGLLSIEVEKVGRGRPKEVISISRDALKVVGIKMGREAVVGILMNGKLEEIDNVYYDVKHDLRNERGYKDLLLKVVEKFEKAKPVGIGLSVSGNIKNGVVSSSILGVKNFNALKFLKDHSKVKIVEVIGDVEALSIYENIVYKGQKFFLVNYGIGIGGCYFSRGKSEIIPLGHIVVKADGEECYCGQRGCLETVASDYAVLKRFSGKEFTIKDFIEYEHEKYENSLKRLWKESEKPSERIMEIYKESIKYLSIAIGNIALVFNPSYVVFYGEGAKKWLVGAVERNVKNFFKLHESNKKLRFYYRNDADAFEKGAAYKVLTNAIKEGVLM